MKVVDIYLAASRLGKYPPLLTSTSVKYYIIRCEVSRNPDLLDWNAGAALMSISYPFCSRQKYTRLCLIKRKLGRREMPGFFRRQANKQLSGCKTLHTSIRLCLTTSRHLLWVLGIQPFLSVTTFKTRLRSKPRIISSRSKSSKWERKVSKKLGSSSLGAYNVAQVVYSYLSQCRK